MRPDSRVSLRPPHITSCLWILNICLVFLSAGSPMPPAAYARGPSNTVIPESETAPARAPSASFAKPELRDQSGVASAVLFLEIIEQRSPVVDHHQQPAARMIVL